jgi:hypothetical protein
MLYHWFHHPSCIPSIQEILTCTTFGSFCCLWDQHHLLRRRYPSSVSSSFSDYGVPCDLLLLTSPMRSIWLSRNSEGDLGFFFPDSAEAVSDQQNHHGWYSATWPPSLLPSSQAQGTVNMSMCQALLQPQLSSLTRACRILASEQRPKTLLLAAFLPDDLNACKQVPSPTFLVSASNWRWMPWMHLHVVQINLQA